VKAAVLDTRNGPRIKLEWQTTDFAHYWDSWHGVSGKAKGFTKQLLAELGIDVTALASEDQLSDELAAREGTIYTVKVVRNGDWVNTDVIERPDHVQAEIPIDNGGLPTPGAAAKASSMFDDNVPF
jgi:hypothetical protein